MDTRSKISYTRSRTPFRRTAPSVTHKRRKLNIPNTVNKKRKSNSQYSLPNTKKKKVNKPTKRKFNITNIQNSLPSPKKQTVSQSVQATSSRQKRVVTKQNTIYTTIAANAAKAAKAKAEKKAAQIAAQIAAQVAAQVAAKAAQAVQAVQVAKAAAQVAKAPKAAQVALVSVPKIDNDRVSNVMWSIGDRYHDWWSADRGDIGAYKKCGDWKFLPGIIRYAILYESIKVFNKNIPNNNYNMSVSSGNNGSEVNTRSLSKYAADLLTYFGGSVSDIEDNMVKKYVDVTPEEFNIPKSLLKNRPKAIKEYKKICESLFGPYKDDKKWFAIVCDAGISPFGNLFKSIVKHLDTENEIQDFCQTNTIPVMYMIQTPQTFADSANLMTFIDCLTIYRFPVTTTTRTTLPINKDYPERDPSTKNHSKHKYETEYNGIFECKFTLFSYTHKIQFHKHPTYSYDEKRGSEFTYTINNRTNGTNVFDIQYGTIDGDKYRYRGPSLVDLMLHYLHLNLHNNTDVFQSQIKINKSIVSFSNLITTHNDYADAPSSTFDGKKTININEILQSSIHQSIDSALGLLKATNNNYRGQTTDITYKPTEAISLCKIPGYHNLPPQIMIDIKHEGDASQVIAADILNKTSEFRDRIVFISEDRPCFAHSVNIGLRTISHSHTIFVYNGVAKAPKARKKGGMYNASLPCYVKCLDVEELMNTIGLYAARYLVQRGIQSGKINPELDFNVVNSLYNDICNTYNLHDRILEDDIIDIEERYTGDIKNFMIILSILYYKQNEINKTNETNLQILQALSGMYTKNTLNHGTNIIQILNDLYTKNILQNEEEENEEENEENEEENEENEEENEEKSEYVIEKNTVIRKGNKTLKRKRNNKLTKEYTSPISSYIPTNIRQYKSLFRES